jgi:hypothetical protein
MPPNYLKITSFLDYLGANKNKNINTPEFQEKINKLTEFGGKQIFSIFVSPRIFHNLFAPENF